MEIHNLDDINKVSKKNTNSVKFKLSTISEKENEEWENKFNELLSDCGCNTGQRYLLFLLPVVILTIVILLILSQISVVLAIFLFIGTTIVLGIMGRVLGIRKRNRKIKRLIVNFYNKYSFMSN